MREGLVILLKGSNVRNKELRFPISVDMGILSKFLEIWE